MRFNRVSKILQIIPRYITIGLLRFVIGLENSPPQPIKIPKLKQSASWSIAFSRASGNQRISSVSSHWHPVVFYFAVIGCFAYFVLV